MRLPAAIVLLFFSAFISISGQQTPAATSPIVQPPRDVVPRSERPAPTGTGIIRGRVVAADTGNPLRRAMVNLSPIMPATGDGGRSYSPGGPRREHLLIQSRAAVGCSGQARWVNLTHPQWGGDRADRELQVDLRGGLRRVRVDITEFTRRQCYREGHHRSGRAADGGTAACRAREGAGNGQRGAGAAPGNRAHFPPPHVKARKGARSAQRLPMMRSFRLAIRVGTTVIVVMGHPNCGAVKAACSGEKAESPNLEAVVMPIASSCSKVDTNKPESFDVAACDHVHTVAQELLSRSEIVSKAVGEGKLPIIEAYYSLDTGEVSKLR